MQIFPQKAYKSNNQIFNKKTHICHFVIKIRHNDRLYYIHLIINRFTNA